MNEHKYREIIRNLQLENCMLRREILRLRGDEMVKPPPPMAESPILDVPLGKGLTFQNLRTLGSAERTASLLLKWGVSWVKFIGESMSPQVHTYWPDHLPDYVAACREAGIDVWLWGWPMPGKAEAYCDQMLMELDRTGAHGIVTNSERHWWIGNPHGRGREIIEAEVHTVGSRIHDIEDEAHAWSIYGHINISGDTSEPGFTMPHEAMAEYADFVQPQWYSPSFRRMETHMETMRQAFGMPVIPVLDPQRADIYKNEDKIPNDGAVNFWSASRLEGVDLGHFVMEHEG